MQCHIGVTCNHPPPRPASAAPAAAPPGANAGAPAAALARDDPRRRMYCGRSWGHASETCGHWCPEADDDACPRGLSCFGDTNCLKTEAPTDAPTVPPPTRLPTDR